MEFFDSFGEDEEDIYNELAENDFGHKIGGYASLTRIIPSCFYKLIQTMILICCGETSVSQIFFITPDNLRRKDFSNVLYNCDCC
ncbi:DUF1963 domain-containing protein [Bacillus mojavensis]